MFINKLLQQKWFLYFWLDIAFNVVCNSQCYCHLAAKVKFSQFSCSSKKSTDVTLSLSFFMIMTPQDGPKFIYKLAKKIFFCGFAYHGEVETLQAIACKQHIMESNLTQVFLVFKLPGDSEHWKQRLEYCPINAISETERQRNFVINILVYLYFNYKFYS